MLTLLVSIFTIPSCQKDDNQTVNELTCEVIYTNVTTTSGNDGSITITVKTGNNGYNYSISSPNLTTPISNTSGRFTTLKAGNYIVKVTDSKQKVFTMTVNITEPYQLTCDVTSTNVTTNGGNNGSITIKVKTGNGGYNYTVNTTSNTTGIFTNLVAGVYNVKVTDSKNSTFNSSVTITEPSHTPVLTLLPATDITKSSATLNGSFNVYGVVSKVYFQFGLDFDLNDDAVHKTPDQTYNSNGVTTTKFNTLDVYTNPQLYFNPNTKVYYKMVIENSNGTYSSDISSFTTLSQEKPSFANIAYDIIDFTSIKIYANISTFGSNTTVSLEYGTTTSYGSSVSLGNIGNSNINVTKNITGLNANTIYHYRLVATNSGGTTYTPDLTFTIELKVGSQMFGGTVFYIDETGQHGKVIQNSDYDKSVIWSNVSVVINGKTWVLPKTVLPNNDPINNAFEQLKIACGVLNTTYNGVNTVVKMSGIYWTNEVDSSNKVQCFDSSNPNITDIYYPKNYTKKMRLITTF